MPWQVLFRHRVMFAQHTGRVEGPSVYVILYLFTPFILGVRLTHFQEHMVSLESCCRFGLLALGGQ
jgi:hypothetical protein